jgi:hypothetical protein
MFQRGGAGSLHTRTPTGNVFQLAGRRWNKILSYGVRGLRRCFVGVMGLEKNARNVKERY